MNQLESGEPVVPKISRRASRKAPIEWPITLRDENVLGMKSYLNLW